MDGFSASEIARSRGDRVVLSTAFLASAGMFAIEIWAGFALDSSALHASAIDFLADTVVYATSLSGMNLCARSRARAALLTSSTTLALGIAVLASTIYHLAIASAPHGRVMGVVGLLAILVNGAVARLLLGSPARGDVRLEGVCRNTERVGALAAVTAAAGVCATGSRWPDLAIGWMVGGLAVSAAWQGIRRARSELRGALVSGVGLALQFASAQAHGIAGNRLFPATLTFDDPAVADEFDGPVISRYKHPGPVEGNVLDTTIGASLTRLLLPELAIMADSNWTEHDSNALRSETGFGPTHLSLKGLLYENDPHETLVSASLAWGIAGLGNPAVHDTPYNLVSPGIFFGRDLGDLPDGLGWLRPFGLTGALSVDFPTSRTSRVTPSAASLGNPTIVHTGIALEFSTLYLTDRFTGKPPTTEPVNQWVPMVEFQFDTPLGGGYGRQTAATVNPGLAYVFPTYQLSVEAIVPLTRRGASSAGVRVGAVFFLDDLLPSLFGKPVFR